MLLEKAKEEALHSDSCPHKVLFELAQSDD
jgi:hypothetical protein